MTNMFARIFRRSESQPKTIRVLVVEGGGVRGIVTGQILGRLEAALGGPLRTYFDMMAGTSSGGISVMALATDSLTDAYDLSTIFNVRSKPFDATSNPMSAGHCMASHTAESSQPGIAQGESESSLSVADRSKG